MTTNVNTKAAFRLEGLTKSFFPFWSWQKKQAVEAVRRAEADYASHARAARRVAAEVFDSRIVLSEILRQIGMEL